MSLRFRHGLSIDPSRSCRCGGSAKHFDIRNFGHKVWRNVRTVIQNNVLGVPRNVAHYIAVSEFSLNVLAYNLKRVISILGIAKTMKAMKLAGA